MQIDTFTEKTATWLSRVVSLQRTIDKSSSMHSISLRFAQELTQRLNQLSIRSTRYKVTLYKPRNQSQLEGLQLTEVETEHTEFAFNIMFERNNPESAWRLVTPLKFTE